MSQTLVAIFETETAANRAVEQLVADGFARNAIDVKVTSGGSSTDSTTTTTTTTARTSAPQDEGVLESIGRFFSDLFSSDTDREYANHYSEAVRRGKAVLTLRVEDESRLDTAHATLLDCDALDVDESVASWRSEGYDATTAGSTGLAAGAVGASASSSANTFSATAARSSTDTGTGTARKDVAGSDREGVIPVIQEELEVGKRRVEQGRVRVVSHVESKPVHESVELQSEKAVIERRPVNRPASEADLSDLRDQTIEVRESAEKAVVNKTAHVVEEVVVGKQVETETKEIHDSVRRTDVSVERDATSGAAATGTSSFDQHRDRFRSDYETNYASSGGSFDEYEPAYRTGYSLRDDARYQGKDWSAIEPHVRSDWESRNPGSSWERFKDAVRRGWERV